MRTAATVLLVAATLLLASCGEDAGSGDRAASTVEEVRVSPASEEPAEERDADHETSADTTGVLAAECAAFSERLEETQGDVGDSNLDRFLGLGDRAEELLKLIDEAPAGIKSSVRVIAENLAATAEATNDMRGDIEDADDIEAMDDLTDVLAAAVAWGQEGNDAVYTIGEHCDLLEVTPETLGPDAYAALLEPGGELDAFARHGLVGFICIYGHCGSQTGGFGGLLGEGAQSGMDDEAQDCWEALERYDPGDDSGCDALYDACGRGDMLACNDLGENVDDGGEYARFADSCGDRADTADLEYQGLCQLLD